MGHVRRAGAFTASSLEELAQAVDHATPQKTARAAEDATVSECAVCFDVVTEPAVLPCACTLSYCTSCWDRSLAAALEQAGRPQCPSCRTPVGVEYDREGQRLRFARADACPFDPNKVYEQAQPLQVRLLQAHGAEAPCVCGAALTRMSVPDRVHAQSDPKKRRGLLRLLEQDVSPLICDVCFQDVPPGGDVYTCTKQGSTILHADNFDICTACFDHWTHAGPEDVEAAEVAPPLLTPTKCG